MAAENILSPFAPAKQAPVPSQSLGLMALSPSP